MPLSEMRARSVPNSGTGSMAKVGCITIPRYFNYGTQLQTYALQETVKSLGYEYEVIDYVNLKAAGAVSRMKRWPKLLAHPLKLTGDLLKRLFLLQYANSRNRKFALFLEEYINLSDNHYLSEEEIARKPPVYDAYICGSDQIWNPGHHKDSTYFLSFSPERKRIAYAPSFGVSSIEHDRHAWMKSMIEGIRELSVREQAAVTIIKELTGRDALNVLDPTLLRTADEWNKIAVSCPVERPYVLSYMLESDKYARLYTKRVAAKLGCAIVSLPWQISDFFDKTTIKLTDAGPREFLGLVRDAEFVCTDSFHGTVFSILFEKPFYSFMRYDNLEESRLFSRIEGLLEKLDLVSRVISRDTPFTDSFAELGYGHVNELLQHEREVSLRFLSSALKSAVGSKE